MSLPIRITILLLNNIIYSMTSNINNFRVSFYIFFLNKILSLLITWHFKIMYHFFLKIFHVLAAELAFN